MAMITVLLAGFGPAAAQTADPAKSTPADPICDYCKDYTDNALADGPVRSAYKPGIGYVAEPDTEVLASNQKRQEDAGSPGSPGPLGKQER
jgi:hypothetical protein